MAKRIASSAVNWTAIAERVPEGQKIWFNGFKAKSDGYLRRMMANPESAPKIDWSAYKGKISPAIVDSFQKQYDAFKIPYPADKVSPEIDAQEKQTVQEITEFVNQSNVRIKEHLAKIAKWDDTLPFEEMTIEDFKDAFPDGCIDAVNNPTFWPHTPEEQLGYQEKGAVTH